MRMKVLVTAGNTMVPVDRVRVITNVFSGRTGAAIAEHAWQEGHEVTLLASPPGAAAQEESSRDSRWRVVAYRTFDDLMERMEREVRESTPDAVIHSAAVSDYCVAGAFAPEPGTRARPHDGGIVWEGDPPALADVSAGKVKSSAQELWLRMVPTPKIIDRIRGDWGFRGVLVKFKLEVEVSEKELLAIAEASRQHSGADLMVANTLEGAAFCAYLGPTAEGYRRIPRRELPERLLEAVQLAASVDR
jgi:phosphopantothenoylcysteine synthetase/decarboxylase